MPTAKNSLLTKTIYWQAENLRKPTWLSIHPEAKNGSHWAWMTAPEQIQIFREGLGPLARGHLDWDTLSAEATANGVVGKFFHQADVAGKNNKICTNWTAIYLTTPSFNAAPSTPSWLALRCPSREKPSAPTPRSPSRSRSQNGERGIGRAIWRNLACFWPMHAHQQTMAQPIGPCSSLGVIDSPSASAAGRQNH